MWLPQQTGPVARRMALMTVWRGPVLSPSCPKKGAAAYQKASDRNYQQESSRRALLVALPLSLTAGSAAAAELNNQTYILRQQYDSYAASYDDLDGGFAAEALGFPELRAGLLGQASGDVLECGVGTGLNLQYYRPAQLTSLTALDLSEGMLAVAQRRATSLGLPPLGLPLAFTEGDAQALPFPPASFDCIVDTFSLCVYPDPLAALRSMASVVRPGGRVLLLEHARSELPGLGWYQDLTAPAVAAVGGKGCVWNQDVLGLVRAAGLRPVNVQQHLAGLIVSVVAERAA